MAIHYQSQIGSICGSTSGKRAEGLQAVLDGKQPFPKGCHMRGPQARLLYLKGFRIKLESQTYDTVNEALKAEFNSKIKKREVWEELIELIEDRAKTVGPVPERLKYFLRFLAIKGDVYTRSYLDRTITEQEDREYINKFFELEGKYAI